MLMISYNFKGAQPLSICQYLIINPNAMISDQNQQQVLAEEFHVKDIQLIKENYEASLKIKRWRLIHSIPALSKRIRKEADTMIHESFLKYIDNNLILLEEGFYENELEIGRASCRERV